MKLHEAVGASSNRTRTPDELFDNNHGLVYKAVTPFKRRNDYREIEQEGFLILWKAAEKYNPSKGEFSSYFNFLFSKRINDYFNSKDKAAFNAKRAVKSSDLSPEEKQLGIDRINHMFVSETSFESEDGENLLERLHGSEEYSAQTLNRDYEVSEEVERAFAKAGLTDKEREVILDAVMRNIPMTEIGKKYGIKKQAIYQTKQKALGKLRDSGAGKRLERMF